MGDNNNAEVATNRDATNLLNNNPRFQLTLRDAFYHPELWPNSEELLDFIETKCFEATTIQFCKEYKKVVSNNIMSKLEHRKLHGSHIVPSYQQRAHYSKLNRLAESICNRWNKNLNIQVRQRMLDFGQVKWDINLDSLPICCAYDLLSNIRRELNPPIGREFFYYYYN